MYSLHYHMPLLLFIIYSRLYRRKIYLDNKKKYLEREKKRESEKRRLRKRGENEQLIRVLCSLIMVARGRSRPYAFTTNQYTTVARRPPADIDADRARRGAKFVTSTISGRAQAPTPPPAPAASDCGRPGRARRAAGGGRPGDARSAAGKGATGGRAGREGFLREINK